MSALLAYLPLLLATIAVELLVVLALAPRGRRQHLAATCVCLNLVTHPLGMLAILSLDRGFTAVELVVLLAELAGYHLVGGVTAVRAAAIAIVANVATVLVALLWW